jgi:galactokinase
MSVRHQLDERARALFQEHFGYPATSVAVAPGRVNVIGEHTDYNQGLTLPAAIDRFVAVAVRPRRDSAFHLISDQFPDARAFAALPSRPQQAWTDYLVGVLIEVIRAGGDRGGLDIAVAADLPVGAGLSSSAALEVASALAMMAAWRVDLDLMTVARLCQGAENAFVGAQTGIMDQVAVLASRAQNALYLDCRTVTWEPVPLPDARYTWLLVDTQVKHELAISGYNQRRRECEAAARALLKVSLRDADEADVMRLNDPVLRRRALHVVRENRRVEDAVAALRRHEPEALGPLLYASHASLRDDFQVSCGELDCLVDTCHDLTGVIGGRMMGAGFGGAVLVLVRTEAMDDAVHGLREAYAERFSRSPAFVPVRAVDGAMVAAAA